MASLASKYVTLARFRHKSTSLFNACFAPCSDFAFFTTDCLKLTPTLGTIDTIDTPPPYPTTKPKESKITTQNPPGHPSGVGTTGGLSHLSNMLSNESILASPSRARRNRLGNRSSRDNKGHISRAMSVVVVPTWMGGADHDIFGIEDNTLEGRQDHAGVSKRNDYLADRAPSVATLLLKSRRPDTTPRLPAFSGLDRHDGPVQKSNSEPDLRRLLHSPTSNDDGERKGDTGGSQHVSATQGAKEKHTVTLHDLRADYVPLHAATDHGRRASSVNAHPVLPLHSGNQMPSKTIVVVPSIDLDGDELKRVSTLIENYEERQLYHLLMLNDPAVRVLFLSSHPVSAAVVRYYLSLRGDGAGVTPNVSDQLSRLYMLSPDDSSKRPLSKKLLARPLVLRLVRRILDTCTTSQVQGSSARSASFDCLSNLQDEETTCSTAGLSVYTGSNSCDTLGSILGLRILESSGETLHFGTKQGSREIFEAAGIPHPSGTPDLALGDDDLLTLGKHNRPGKKHWAEHHPYIRSPHALAVGLARQIVLKGVRPRKWMIKLNQGFSGMGNASLNLQDIQERNYGNADDTESRILAMTSDIEAKLPFMKFECPCLTWSGCEDHIGFKEQIAKLGVIAEAFLDGEVPTSPSFQAVVEPDSRVAGGHSVRMLSTHEQLLDGQIYEGCINPCSSRYRDRVMDYGRRIGEQLEANGVVGHFSADFLATKDPNDGSWDLNAVEINLRQGGTTHPHANMALLCGGQLDDDGIFHLLNGEPRYYVATDCYRDDGLKGMSDTDLVTAVENDADPLARKIRWDPEGKTGVVFHLFRFVTPYGRIGFTAIGSSSDSANLLYDDAARFLKEVAKKRTKC